MKTTIIVPVRNEEATLADTLTEIRRMLGKDEYEFLVVDDGSADKSADIARGQGWTVLQHSRNMGYGAALKTGIRHAHGDVIVTIDGDGTYPVKHIPELLAHMETCDMVVGARTGKNVKIPVVRRPAKFILTKFASLLSGERIPDINSGLRVFRKDTAMQYFYILPGGFSFTTTLTLAMLSDGYLVKYVPIEYHRRAGKSKIRPLSDTLNIFFLIVRTMVYFYPLKVFFPMATLFWLTGLGWISFTLVKYHNVTDTGVLLVVVAILTTMLGLLADLIVRRSAR